MLPCGWKRLSLPSGATTTPSACSFSSCVSLGALPGSDGLGAPGSLSGGGLSMPLRRPTASSLPLLGVAPPAVPGRPEEEEEAPGCPPASASRRDSLAALSAALNACSAWRVVCVQWGAHRGAVVRVLRSASVVRPAGCLAKARRASYLGLLLALLGPGEVELNRAGGHGAVLGAAAQHRPDARPLRSRVRGWGMAVCVWWSQLREAGAAGMKAIRAERSPR